MKKLLIAFCFAICAASAQTATLNMQLQFASPILQDVAIYWSQQVSGTVGTLAAPIAATDTSIQVTLPAPQIIPTVSNVLPAAGQTILIEADAMTITSVSITDAVATLGVTRNVVPQFLGATHAQGATATAMQYQTPYTLAADALRKWAVSISQSLGQKSAVFAATVSGSIQQ